jgi:hypothetical protein
MDSEDGDRGKTNKHSERTSMLWIAAGSSSSGNTSLVALLVAFVPLLIMAVALFFVFRWQFRLFNDLRDSMHRIADAIESIANRR